MATTITVTADSRLEKSWSFAAAQARGMLVAIGEIAWGSHAAGGAAFAIGGMDTPLMVICSPKGGYVIRWDVDNTKLVPYYDSGSTNAVMAQCATGTDLSTVLSGVPFIAFGVNRA